VANLVKVGLKLIDFDRMTFLGASTCYQISTNGPVKRIHLLVFILGRVLVRKAVGSLDGAKGIRQSRSSKSCASCLTLVRNDRRKKRGSVFHHIPHRVGEQQAYCAAQLLLG
jgi:hypothetical protein